MQLFHKDTQLSVLYSLGVYVCMGAYMYLENAMNNFLWS